MKRRIFEPRMDGMVGGWRKLHRKDLHNLYSFPSIMGMTKSRNIRWEGYVAHIEKRNALIILVGKPEGKRPE
jgi:hypothetical protein